MFNIIIHVLNGNSAYKFYEKLGGRILGTTSDIVDGVCYKGISYGWGNIDILS